MSTEGRLCCVIIEEEFGPFASKVARELIQRGRLTLADITRFTQLQPKQVRECLFILIQHGLVYFAEPLEGQRGATYYQIGAEKVLLRLRMGLIQRFTEEQFGEEGLDICKLLFVHGRMTLQGAQAYLSEKFTPNHKKTFTRMATGRFIAAVMPEHSRSVVDRLLEVAEKKTQQYTITTSKENEAIKRAAQAQVEAEYSANESIGMKRRAIDSMDLHKKRAAYSHAEEEDVEVDETVFFAVNYEQYNMMFRNDFIVDYAVERINRTAGQVIKAFLKFGKDKIRMLKEEDSPPASRVHIANMLMSEDISHKDILLQSETAMRPDSTSQPTTLDITSAYITLLATDQAGFLKSKDEAGANQFAINFAKLRESMKRRLLEALIRERYGVATCRIMRILIEKGKLDESQIQKLAMLPTKDTREKLGLLNTKGYVEIQEVPRSADRAPGRCFHLWYVPLEKCYYELLVDVYRVMGNLQQRKKKELDNRRRLLDKLSRQDVKENMDLLGEGDKVERQELEKTLERIEVIKSRLDAMAMVLRDF